MDLPASLCSLSSSNNDTVTEERSNLLLPPAACPFSGVAIDPNLWESLQSKLALNDAQHHSGVVAEEERGLANAQPKLASSVETTVDSTTYRVQVINESTERSKDLLLDRNNQQSLFDAVYDNPRVKEAHIRKWGSQISSQVKCGLSEIRVKVMVGDHLCCWFTLDEMKQTNTEELYKLTQKNTKRSSSMQEDVRQLYLVCVDKQKVEQPHSLSSVVEEPSRKGRHMECSPRKATKTIQQVEGSCSPHRTMETIMASQLMAGAKKSTSRPSMSSHSTVEPSFLSPLDELVCFMPQKNDDVGLFVEAISLSTSDGITNTDSSTLVSEQQLLALLTSNQAKTTMGVRVINRATKRSKDLVLQINDTDTIFVAVYDHPGVRAAHVRKWGRSVVQSVKQGTAEIQFCVWDDDTDRPWKVFSIEELKTTTTRQLYELVSESSNLITIYLQCVRIDGPTSISEVNNSCSGRLVEYRMEPLIDHHQSVESPCRTASRSSCSSIDEDSPHHHDAELSSLERQRRQAVERLNLAANIPRQPSLRLEKDGRPRFSMETNTDNQKLAEKLTLQKPKRASHMKLSSDSLPRTRSFPTTQAALSESADMMRRIGSTSLVGSPSKKTMEIYRQEGSDLDPMPVEPMYSNALWRSPKKSPSVNRLLLTMGHSSEVLREHATHGKSVNSPPKQKILMSRTEEQSTALDVHATQQTATDVSIDNPGISAILEKVSVINDNNLTNANAKSNAPTHRRKTSDKIARFLAFQKETKASASPHDDNSTEKHSSSISTQKSPQCGRELPPLKEISVMADNPTSGTDSSTPTGLQGISLPANVVKDVFPYHLILDTDFCIIQVGNNLEGLLEQTGLVGRSVNDILTVTNPIPMIQGWDWTVLEKMKDKTMFLESVSTSPEGEKRKLKGTIVEVSASPKHVMFVLFPNVKNLAEMEDANLSMADLPLHSCQRETVLFGEHSKSEVNLTNHLDKLHRDLIDSMEQQIKDRTEELAAAFRNLEAANARLALQSARQLEHFACMSHEIRTPLNCIVGISSLLLDDANVMEPMHADSIQMINTSGELLKAVVDDVLDYAKLESGSFEVDIKETNLQNTLNSVAHSMSEKMREKEVRLRLDYSPLLPEFVETDSRRLQQVLFNLLGNAGKFSKQGSAIDLTVSLVPVESTEVDPAETSNGQVIRFEIKDYGKGIECKDFQTIFEPFSQASKETQTLYGGTGLGLSITSKLVHRLGGTITLQSEYGKFAEFTVNLPMRGKSVDIQSLKTRVQNTVVVLVEKVTVYDYSFTDYAIKPEPIPFGTGTTEAYEVDVERCTSLEQAFQRIKDRDLLSPNKHYAVLVDEDLYQPGFIERLDTLVDHLNHTLMTFGPNFSVEVTRNRHFKSLTGVFASSLIEKIAGCIERRRMEKMELSPTSSADESSKITPSEGLPKIRSSALLTSGVSPVKQQTQNVGLTGRAMNAAFPAQKNTSNERTHLKILYAEDNKVNQKVLSRILNRAGVTNLTIVDNGKKAVDLTETEQFDIIFMDIQMPVMDGMEATKIITGRNPLEKVIFCTAHALEEFKEQTEAVGATHFISKPFRLAEIDNVFKELGY